MVKLTPSAAIMLHWIDRQMYYVTPHISNPQDYDNHVFKDPKSLSKFKIRIQI
jgi:hypothetical protein